MAAANFSRDAFNKFRDSIECGFTNSGDLIDFETVLENPPFAKVWNHDFGVYRPLGKQKLHNYCDWLKIGKNERCGKRCEQFYCRNHSEYINKGGIICCGVGVRRSNQLCTGCEKNMGLNINKIKQARCHYKWDAGEKESLFKEIKIKKNAAHFQSKREISFILARKHR